MTFLTVNAVVAETHDEAMALLLPNLQMMARLRTGQPLGPLDLVEDAEQTELSPQEQPVVEAGLRRAVVGIRSRPPNRCVRWPRSSTSTR